MVVGVSVAVFGPPHLSNDIAVKDDNVLHIAGIFPIGGKGGWQGGQVRVPEFINFKMVKNKYIFLFIKGL